MERHRTIGARVELPEPAQMRRLDRAGIIGYLRAHYSQGPEPPHKPANKATAYMIAVSKAIFDPANWKNPIAVEAPAIRRAWVKACIVWYHGAEPHDTGWIVYSNGYACG